MKTSFTVILLTFALFTAACIPTINPLYTDADLTTDPAIVGVWEDKESGEIWSIANAEKYKYALVQTETSGSKTEYDARLVKVGDDLFLDVVPVKSGLLPTDLHSDSFIARHTFVRVILKESTVQISYMEPRWLKDFLASNPDAIRHEKIKGEVILTSSPKETQKFILAHLHTPEAFSSSTEFVRKRGGS